MVLKGMRTYSNEELLKHIFDLAHAFKVDLQHAPGMRPEEAISYTLFDPKNIAAGAVKRVIVSIPVRDEATYALALHEMGHTLHPTGAIPLDPEDVHRVLAEESAWQWAEHYALCWTVCMEQVKTIGLQSYYDSEQRHKLARARAKHDREQRQKDLTSFVKGLKL